VVCEGVFVCARVRVCSHTPLWCVDMCACVRCLLSSLLKTGGQARLAVVGGLSRLQACLFILPGSQHAVLCYEAVRHLQHRPPLNPQHIS
jgi:hypothetical protein